jgi:hypothetical protein
MIVRIGYGQPQFIQNHKYDAVTDAYNNIYGSAAHQNDIEIEQANFDLFNQEEW